MKVSLVWKLYLGDAGVAEVVLEGLGDRVGPLGEAGGAGLAKDLVDDLLSVDGVARREAHPDRGRAQHPVVVVHDPHLRVERQKVVDDVEAAQEGDLRHSWLPTL